MEPRSAIAEYDAASDRWTLRVGCQGVFGLKGGIANVLGVERDKVRVLTGNGNFLAIRSAATLGAYVGRGTPIPPTANAVKNMIGVYRTPLIEVSTKIAVTNTAAVGIYRGAGRPEAAMLLERLVEDAARRLGIDPVALRRLNLVPPDAMPWATPTGETLDSGDYPRLLDEACARFDYGGARRRQAQRRAEGALVGLGIGLYVEPCGQGWESARVTLHADGTATVVASGSSPQGQGGPRRPTDRSPPRRWAARSRPCTWCRATPPPGPRGIGALASRSIAIGGSAIAQAAREARARRAAGEALPLTVETVYHAPAEAWSSGCVIAQVAVDPQTGAPTIERIVWVDDAGRIVNPLLAEGQLLGGLAQGVGQAMLERVVYDDEGQLLTGSLMDYALPRATDIPPVELHGLHTPTAANALGAKGVGEAGCIGVPAAILNAAIDALSEYGIPPHRHAGDPAQGSGRRSKPPELRRKVERTRNRNSRLTIVIYPQLYRWRRRWTYQRNTHGSETRPRASSQASTVC